MKVLLTSNASHVPPRGGSTRSNLVWLRHLAKHGHECRVVAAAAEHGTARERARTEAELREQALQAGDEVVSQDGIRFFSVDEPSQRPLVLRREIEQWKPDWVLVSSEDLGHGLLREAFRSAPTRVVYLAHTPQFFPFGTESWHPDEAATRMLKGAAGTVTISHSVSKHVQQHLDVAPRVVHPPIYGHGPWPCYENWSGGQVAMINPCAVKGISIFLALAKHLPHVPFSALRGWGTTGADEAALEELPNVTVHDAVQSIDAFLKDTRILLMPSLWYEGFGLIVMEAMLRGIPVISSDYGGLTESTLGVGYLAPIHPIEKYTSDFDERHMPVPVIREPDLGPWLLCLQRLLGERDTYERVSEAARKASAHFVNSLDAGEFQRYLEHLRPSVPTAAAPVGPARTALSPEKRALLLRRLKQKA